MSLNADQVIDQILKEKFIVIVRNVPREKLLPLAEAAYKGGVRLLECTYDATGKTPDEQIADNIKMLVDNFGDVMTIGAGTVLKESQVLLTKAAGGKFIISPDVNVDVIACTKKEGLVSLPGALTPSEITAADRAGADFVKLFPIDSLGASYVKAITAPLSHVRLLAVGGVDENNIETYWKAGVCGFGCASNIFNKEMIKNNDFAGIEELARRFCEKIALLQ